MIVIVYKNQPLLSLDTYKEVLTLIASYPFPLPSEGYKGCNGKEQYFNIATFADKQILKALTPKIRRFTNEVMIDNAFPNRLSLLIRQGKNVGIHLYGERLFLNGMQRKNLFRSLLNGHTSCLRGQCEIDNTELYQRNFDNDEVLHKTMLGWLHYFSQEELEKRGGFAAFELNPYLYTERIHDGLYVQVGGDDPAIFDTPEGERLLVNAINALPLIQKD
ncbi:MAG: hypothetical protein RLZZ628_2469 [Bacteroidota bacterium]|jgi:hypothetical protein